MHTRRGKEVRYAWRCNKDDMFYCEVGVAYLMQEIHCALIEGLEIRNGEFGFDLRLTVL